MILFNIIHPTKYLIVDAIAPERNSPITKKSGINGKVDATVEDL